MTLRYLAWKEMGHWQGHKLLTVAQINSVLQHLDWKHEVFATIQQYDEHEEIVSCPIYADFDHKSQSLEKTKAEVQAFVFRLMGELNVVPEIYFSGNKGFHVVIPYPIASPHCHYLVRHVVQHFGQDLSSLDKSVYRPRAMFRLPGSPASTPGRFKTRLSRDELFTLSVEEIVALSTRRTPRLVDETDVSKISESLIGELLQEASTKLPTFRDVKAEAALTPVMTPCLRHFLQKGVAEGQRNKALFILAKFFKQSGLDMETAMTILLKKNHIRQWDESGEAKVGSVLRSVYRSHRETRLGCKKGSDAELMQSYCSPMCPFNPKFPELHFTRKEA